MKKQLLYGLVFVLFAFAHPFYLSVTDLKYNLKSKAFEGTVKIFTNDLEKALRQFSNKGVDLLHPRDSVAIKAVLQQYLNARLKITTGNKELQLKVVGFENEEEATWTYVESTSFEPKAGVEVRSEILLDQIPEQSNIVQIEMHGKQLNYKLSKTEKAHVFFRE